MDKQQKYEDLRQHIDRWARELGFQQVGVATNETHKEVEELDDWLNRGYHGTMEWMGKHRDLRAHPEQLVSGATRVISARMNYLPPDTQQIKVLKSPELAYLSRYALGRDYHKLIRKRLAQLANNIEQYAIEQGLCDDINQRAFVDSAPVLERPFAEKAGLGWVGKHTLLINQEAGSWFFLGEIFTNLPLPVNPTVSENRCEDCTACLKVCPTDAFPEPYVLDARRCISYLTIENKDEIPLEYREPMGNRVFGCDDCQAICPWNKFAHHTKEDDFKPRHNLDNTALLTLFEWSEEEFLEKTAGSPIRRIGFTNWQRNLSVGLGNAPSDPSIISALQAKIPNANAMLDEHFSWALAMQQKPAKRRQRKIKNPEKTS